MAVGQTSASCNDDEMMASAYCTRMVGGPATSPPISLDGIKSASCEGEGAVAVVACVKR
jgi:hypothetical protein